MSFLTRITNRSVSYRSSSPVVMPKGIAPRQSVPIARAEDAADEDETLSAARVPTSTSVRREETKEPDEAARQSSPEDGEEELAPLRRQQDGEEEEGVAPLRRQAEEGEEEIAPLRRQADEEKEESLAALRRQADEGEEEVAPLRRMEDADGEEDLQTMRSISRQEEVPLEETGQLSPPQSQSSLVPGAEPTSPDLVAEEEPPAMQALHRETQSAQNPIPTAPSQYGEAAMGPAYEPPAPALNAPPLNLPSVPDVPSPVEFASPNMAHTQPSPNVVIDQLDVLIHEPAPAPERRASAMDRGRSFRARYLRRL